jgi:hypothetical protein
MASFCRTIASMCRESVIRITTGAPEGRVLQGVWRRCDSCQWLWPLAANRALPDTLQNSMK